MAKSKLEYGPRGLIAILTPQANTTVEPELAILCPPGFAMINGRLTSDKATVEARLADYFEQIEKRLEQFSNAPVDAFAFACTGASYLAGKVEEDRLVERLEHLRGVPFVTAGRAVADALRALGATRIGLVSPYPPALTEASQGYWVSRGFTVAETVSTFNPGSDFHPIYSLSAASADDALQTLRGRPLDAIVMLGTGMPTLTPIRGAVRWGGPPVLSCMLALAWRSVTCAAQTPPTGQALMRWVNAEGWGERLTERLTTG